MSHPVTWFQINSSRNDASLGAFYKKVFGWKMSKGPGGPMLMIAPDKGGGIAGGVGPSQDGRPSVAVYANTANLEKHLAKAEAAGGRAVTPPVELPGGFGRIAGFLDPDGNWFGLWQPAKKQAAKKAAKKSAKKSPKKGAKKAAKKKAAKKRR